MNLWTLLLFLIACKPGLTIPATGAPAERAEAILAAMTLEQKVGQTMVIAFDGPELDRGLRRMIEDYHIGGVIVYRHNIRTLRGMAELSNELQQTALNSGHVPLILCIDQEGGWASILRQKQGATEFPSQMAVAATGDPENARRMASVMAAEMRALGLNMNLTPVADVNNNPHNPIIGSRSFGDDPGQVSEFVTAMIETYQAAGVMATAKHFPGHGDTTLDSHFALPTVLHDRRRLERVELVPFRAAIAADVAVIMTAHITFPAVDDTPGLPATLSPKVLTDLLRREMGYKGLLITDSLAMGAIEASGRTIPQAAVEALAAGADLLLFAGGYDTHRAAYRELVWAVHSGRIPLARLDDAVRRILLYKARYGILDWQPVNPEMVPERVGTEAHRAVAYEIASQAVTLVRDEADLLPLATDAQVLVVEFDHALGLGQALPDATVLQLSRNPSRDEIASVLERAADVVLVATADVSKFQAQAELVSALLDSGWPVVVAAVRAPYDLLHFPAAPTYIAAYSNDPATLAATVDVLFGRAQPQGHLPVELPGLYERGHGLNRGD
jgi:beta-N-acetylhexosaminidase